MKEIHQKVLLSAFDYDCAEGCFIWRRREGVDRESKRFNAVFSGRRIRPVTDRSGYLTLQLDGVRMKVHRAVFAYHHGYYPVTVDHINGDRADNRIENLRPATKSEQQWNKRAKGCWLKGSMWVAAIKLKGKRTYLGSFQTEAAALEAYREAKTRLHNSYGL